MTNIGTEKKLRMKLFISLIIYTLAGYILVILFDYGFSRFSNTFFLWLHLRIDLIYFLYLIIGFVCIFYHYWKKPWEYLQEVMNATKIIYQLNDSTIELSEPLKDMEKQMNQIKMAVLLSQQAVKEAENKKNELVMYLAHDIRTPLTSVIGYLSLLDEAPDMPIEQKAKYVGIALKKSMRLEKLIDEFFEITRYNTQQIQLTKTNVDLYYMFVQLIDEFYPVLSAKGNSVILNANENLMVYADSEKLARVFNNMLKNAVAYSYPNTEILIYVQKEQDKIKIKFENQGHTIPPEQLSTIFEKFNRLDDARKSDSGGAGLGLSIANEIILLHGGEILAQSENDRIIFTVLLPIQS
ncbi:MULTISPECIES: sensor histidine kinase [unclassified Clostridioides]|uniref:sensor histidine kinase n=1 Tax=unclassified Clostridioides TaxID=2635829 RepID=UPI001D0FD526|nr:HAMP domain-containing histidine kinase [Clostridioides sp. ES-S-0001-02]MCC0656365.1 HAMP domain-containing histidine kinase [Clostridioides sp. ES-S-0123-01]